MKKNFYHGIMFHHFHDTKHHLKSQGSISKDQFFKLIKFVGRKNILDADIFFERLKLNSLKENEVCFTFDDGIKSQIDVALPVLEDFKIKSFFFVYSSMFEGKLDNLEIYRYFRTNYFESIDEFYKAFFKELNTNLEEFYKDNNNTIKLITKRSPFYTENDIKFRLVRDKFLDNKKYDEIMNKIFLSKNFTPEKFYKNIVFDKNDLIKLDSLGHLIGLHSHSHPTLIEKLSFDQQKKEYYKCLTIISKILNKTNNSIKYMSHPCGSYNKDTLRVLDELGIELGFKQFMSVEREKGMKKINNSNLEIAREDHSEIIRRI